MEEEKKSKVLFKIDKHNIVTSEDTKYVVDKYLQQNNIKETLEFPGKILFSNFKDKNIQSRKQKLEQYLSQVSLLIPNLLEIPFAKDFFEVPCQIPSEHPPQKHRRSESTFVFEFLKKINNSSLEMAKASENFEELYFTAAPQFSLKDIRLLFLGDSTLKGLLYFCGECTNYIATRSCLQLFSKLISYEHNSLEADKFVSVFCSVNPDVIRDMHLEWAIKEIKSQSALGQNALYQYIAGNTHGITSAKEILDDKIALEEYEKWASKKSITGPLLRQRESFSTKYKQEEEDQVMKQLMKKSLVGVEITKLLVESSNLSALNDMKELMDQLDSYSGWKLTDSTEFVDTYTKGTKQLRFTLRLNTSNIKTVTRYLYELDKRAKWDPLSYEILKKDNDYQDIVQVLYEYLTKKHKYVEYVLFRNIGRSEDGKSVIIILRSIILPLSSIPIIKRTHINACVYKVTLKKVEGETYTECQMVWKVEEGLDSIAEHVGWTKRKLEENLKVLNELLEGTN